MARDYLPAARALRVCLFVWTIPLLWDCSSVGLRAQERVANTNKVRLESYELQHQSPADVERMLGQLLGDLQEQVQIVTDPKRHQILLKGPEKAHEITRQLLKSVDKPGEIRRAESGRPVLRVYPCERSEALELAKHLQQRWGKTPNVRVALDSSGDRILIVAAPDVHNRIIAELSSESTETFTPAIVQSGTVVQPAGAVQSQTISASVTDLEDDHVPTELLTPRFSPDNISMTEETPAPYARGKRTPTPEALTPSVSEVETRTVVLQHSQVATQRETLQKILKAKIVSAENPKLLELKNSKGETLRILGGDGEKSLQLQGDREFATQVETLIRMLDQQKNTSEKQTKIIPLRGADPKKIRQAVEAYQQHLPARGNADPNGKQSQLDLPTEEANATIKLTAFQASGGDLGGSGAGNAGAGPNVSDDSINSRLKNVGVDVQVETLPDLDVIILRGNERDVQEMTKILEEIERISEETEPIIEVLPLKHVDSQSLSALILKTNADLIGWRQGKVSVTPLIKPNSLLLIGWGEAVLAMRELIAKLDQPSASEGEFQVFRLKHAAATPTQQTVLNYFEKKPGLNGSVQVIADPRTNALIVQTPPREMQEAAKLIEQLDSADSQAVNQARVVKLKNTLATDLAPVLAAAISAAQGGSGTGPNSQKSAVLELLTIDAQGEKILKSGILNDVKITPDPRTNTLVVSSPMESMELVLALIAQLDELPPDVAQIKVFRVVNGDVRSLALMLRSLFPGADVPGGQANLSNAPGESTLIPLRFSVDLRTNSIIATGSSGDLRIVEALLLRLDEKDIKQRKTHVYRLKNTPVGDVAKAISEMLQMERQIEQAQAGGFAGVQQVENEVVVVAEEIGNNLIISASPRYFDDIKELIEKLDAEPPEVMIQVLIAEVALNNADEFGVELGLQDSVLFDRSLLGNLVTNGSQIVGASNTPGFNFNNQALGNSGAPSALADSNTVGAQGLSHFNLGRTNSDLGFGGLVLSASSESVSVLIRALQENRRLEVLSRPQLRTLDNQPGFVQVGQRVPTIQNTTLNSFGQTNSVMLENVGLILGVTPRISPEGMVVMELDAEKSDISSTSQGIPISISANGEAIYAPIFNVTQASTTVSAADGETIIIGGLITKSTNSVHRRIPMISDVPVLGNLFRYDSVIDERTELLIILTPHVIRNPLDAEKLKQIEAARMHWTAADVVELTGDQQLLGSIDPSHVLNADTEVIFPDTNPRGEWIAPEPTMGQTLTPAPQFLPEPLPGSSFSPGAEGGLPQEQSGPPPTTEELSPLTPQSGETDDSPNSGPALNPAPSPEESPIRRTGGFVEPPGAVGRASLSTPAAPQKKRPGTKSNWKPFWKKEAGPK